MDLGRKGTQEELHNNNRPGIIVIGGHVQGLGITRIFGRNGIEVVVFDTSKKNIARHSKYCKEFYEYEKGELVKTLEKHGAKGDFNNWLLMPTNDEQVWDLSINKILLSKYFVVSTVNLEILKVFYNKRNTYQLAQNMNIPIPKTFMVDNWEELENSKINFPCIIKPAVMHTFYSAVKKKVFLCNNWEELKMNYSKALSLIPNNEIIVQDIVPGGSENQYSVGFMFDGKDSLVTLPVRRARQHPINFGNATTYAETIDMPELIAEAKSILKEVKYVGVCEVEFKYDSRDRKYKFLEVNPRTWKWHSISEKSESPILMSFYNFLYGFSPIVKNDYKHASFRHIITDVPTWIKMKFLGYKTKTYRKNLQHAVWSKQDLKPALYELLYLAHLIKTR